MPIKITKAIKELNVGRLTIEAFLRKKGIEVDQSVNARIDDDVYQMLIKEFNPDKLQKAKSEALTSGRQKEKKQVEEIKTVLPGQTYTVVGKLDRSDGTPKILTVGDEQEAAAPVAEPESATTAEPASQPEAPVEEATPATPAEEQPVEHNEQTKPDTIVDSEPAQSESEVPTPVQETEPEPVPEVEQGVSNNTKNETEAAQVEADDDKPAESEEAPEATQAEAEPAHESEAVEAEPSTSSTPEAKGTEPEVFRYTPTPELQGPKVVGKVDLDSLNQQTRPKKKTKEEKRNERMAKAQAQAESNSRRKRKRISKEKVDISSTAAQLAQQSGNSGGGGNSSSNKAKSKADSQSSKRKEKKAKRPLRTEVSEEDVQRQVKETLARLTAKANKKSAKLRREKREAFREEERELAAQAAADKKVLKLTEFVTANDLAAMMNIPVVKVIGTCMSLGVMVSINQRLDAETINIVAEEFGFKTEYTSAEVVEAIHDEVDNPEDMEERPPVVTVMGHVDHGKTSLLDHIRNTNVIAGEAGGITQHIGAYTVKLKNGRRITFLDTPGHAAFTAMRARGAKVTDIVIVIVAADDSVMPQTEEALSHASAAGVPIIFAINKIDKPGANSEKIKEELAARNYLVEDWGGTYQSQDISAKKGTGVYELLEKVLLEADLLDLKANPNRKATGSIIESSLDKGRGYVATVLVDGGTLHVGDIVLAGTHFGKVKAMFNERNERITEAGPSQPALILGLNGAPTAGDKFNVMDTDQEARQIAGKREQLQREQTERTMHRRTLDDIGRLRALGEFHELNVIVKGDVDGSIEALSDSLIKLSTPEVQVNVIHKAVGAITESDVTLAAASDAYIIGFQVRPSADAKRLAAQEGVDIRIYSIIYDCIEEVKSAMEGMLAPEVKEELLGTAEVRQVYHISKVGTIAGAMVTDGKIKRQCKVRVIRDGIVIYTGNLASLKRFKDDVKEVASGYDCGFSVQSYNDIKEGDIIEAFEEIEVQKSL
ncbi:MAG: translation initiation factor IF-2 [Muribaculaceae bacterium]|nr:translation initiation factor IF-2 [Muribaculaceae bacterium]